MLPSYTSLALSFLCLLYFLAGALQGKGATVYLSWIIAKHILPAFTPTDIIRTGKKITPQVERNIWLCIYMYIFIRESVDSLYRNGVDPQYIQYLSKSHEIQPWTCFRLKEVPSVHLREILQPAKLTSFPKSIMEESLTQKCVVALIIILFSNDNSQFNVHQSMQVHQHSAWW